MMKVTFVGAKFSPRFYELANNLEGVKGLKVQVSPYASFGPQIFVEPEGIIEEGEAYDVQQKPGFQVASSFKPVNFSAYQPSSAEVVAWLSKELLSNGYIMQESAIFA